MRFSIITPSFNSAATIADTLRSIDEQRDIDVEHLIVDGASTDATMEIVDRHAQPWRHCSSGPDRGLYDAMNKGLVQATGDVVGFLNSDDFYPSNDVLKQVAAAFEADASIEAIYGDLCYVRPHEPGRIVRFWRSSPHVVGMFAQGWVPPHPTVFVKRAVYDACGGFDLKYRMAADWELLARIFEVRRVKSTYLPKVLVHMRLGGLTNRSWRNVWRQNREIWEAMRSHGFRSSPVEFTLRKLWSRGMQYIARN